MPEAIIAFSNSQNDPHRFLAHIGAGRSTMTYKKNATIFVQGVAADAVYFIQSGRVSVSVTSDLGKEAIVAVLEAGQFFGEGCLGQQTHRIATTTALDESRISTIPKAAMNEALANEPAFAKFFMEHLLSRNSRIEGDVIDQLFNSSEKRLARLLLLLANYGKGGQPPIAPVTFSQEQLAEMVGTTRSRVSAFMNKFRKLGFIDYNGEIHVHVALLNSVLADKPEIRQAEVEEPA
jgi:CRP/FNR family cyclic AMP-dependent transcriptional regulator